MKLTVSVDRMRLFARHGVSGQERRTGNLFEVSLTVSCPGAIEGAEADDLAHTVSYADLTELIRSEMSVPAQLIEHVAWRIARRVVADFPAVDAGSVTVSKLTPPCGAEMAAASVTLRWP
ncbi:dihydroneopterin aldolase [Paramuribaculum intestinale]|uniref:dihydroneopterin aldolase n=1 Tax=Paramuribaculum intestinale TaxID=2094151 RepID=UPI000F47EBC7|nr:dihydroneopterin aldolase [Paramuribaculum intestinale]ROS94567.1 dihydroneopterin aldolase [Muribaculaceae bacterium Isolate-043 (Harlan)]ROT16709.1 dihydroneopterin aldolase [Muribaculaceae bacterium Isolate-105 (HZI)]RXE62673.1 dihydroneopterin aldolase [Muribaculaceae bacterium Isolate-004 (NCI)]